MDRTGAKTLIMLHVSCNILYGPFVSIHFPSLCQIASSKSKKQKSYEHLFPDQHKVDPPYVTCRMSHVTCDMSNAYVDRWDMLNKFCFHLYAQKLLFIGENCNGFFLTSAPSPVTLEIIES